MSNPPASQGNWQSSASEPNTWHQLSDIQFEHVAGIFIGGRSGQEDSIGLLGPARTNAESVFVVCDGMGGEKGGARASGLVRDSLLQGYATERSRRSPDQAMKACIERAHQSILQIGAAEPEFASMGTTVVSLATNGRTVWHAHSGDSRLYEFEQGELKRRTKDHTRVQRMIDENIVPKDVAEKLPDAHVLSHAVGRGELRVDCGMFDLEDRPRRTYLLASDGLHGVVSDEIISKAMAGFDAGRAVRILMEMIRALEGSDNTSVIVLRFGPQAREGDETALFQQASDEAGKRIAVTLTNGTARTFAPRRKTPKDGIPVHRYIASESAPAPGRKWLSKLNIGLGVLLLCAVAAAAALSRKSTSEAAREGSGAPKEATAVSGTGASSSKRLAEPSPQKPSEKTAVTDQSTDDVYQKASDPKLEELTSKYQSLKSEFDVLEQAQVDQRMLESSLEAAGDRKGLDDARKKNREPFAKRDKKKDEMTAALDDLCRYSLDRKLVVPECNVWTEKSSSEPAKVSTPKRAAPKDGAKQNDKGATGKAGQGATNESATPTSKGQAEGSGKPK